MHTCIRTYMHVLSEEKNLCAYLGEKSAHPLTLTEYACMYVNCVHMLYVHERGVCMFRRRICTPPYSHRVWLALLARSLQVCIMFMFMRLIMIHFHRDLRFVMMFMSLDNYD